MTTQVEQPTTTVTVLGEQGVIYNLDAFPEDKYNRLIPTETIRMPSDLIVPDVQVVRLDPDPDGGDVYHSNDMKPGHNAPTARGLSKLVTGAGISFIDERRVDDGSEPFVCGVKVTAEMTLPTGQRISTTAARWVDMRRMAWKDGLSAPQAAKFKAHLYEHTATRARNRAIRYLLSLRGSYPAAELARPFAVVRFLPNMNHPEVRARALDAMMGTVSQVYGPAAAAQIAAPIIIADDAPDDDDEPIEGQATEIGGPSWFDDEAAASTEPSRTERLVSVLREAASQSGMVGAATEPQRARLQVIFKPLGLEATAAGLRIAYGLASLAAVTAAQASALINVATSSDFPDLWRELVAGEKGAAA